MLLSMQKCTSIFLTGIYSKLHHLTRFVRNYNKRFYSRAIFLNKKENDFAQEKFRAYRSQFPRKKHSMLDIQKDVINERKEMEALWPEMLRNAITLAPDEEDLINWMRKVFEYNVPNGKKIRGLTAIATYKDVMPQKELTDENMRLIRILAWCIEFFQGFYTVIDDIVDHSATRRGQPCWYLYNNIGTAAANDGFLIEEAAYHLFNTYFKNNPSYLQMLETCQDVNYKTVLGQMIDLLYTNCEKKTNLNRWTMPRYDVLAKYKTSYYSIIMPVKLAMLFAGIKESDVYRQVDDILLDIGHYFQVRNDFLDCFGNNKNLKQFGNDIQEGKCTWFAVSALQRATPGQRKIMEDCYGINDVEVMQVYHELGLESVYSEYEVQAFNFIQNRIQKLPRSFPRHSIENVLNTIRHLEE